MENNQGDYRLAISVGELSARVKSIEDRVTHVDSTSHSIISELRDEIRNNTEKFERIIDSLNKLINDHREDVSVKIGKAVKDLEDDNAKTYVSQTQFSKIEHQLNGLTSKLTMIWSGIIIFGYAVNWIIAHPGVLTIFGPK